MNELVIGVAIALGLRTVADCPAIDADHDGSVTISELVAAVNQLLLGCGITPPTPLDTETPPATQTASPQSTPTATATETATDAPTDSPTPIDTLTPTPAVYDFGPVGVVNELDNSVSFVARQQQRSRRAVIPAADRIRLEGVPRDIAISGDGRLAYVTTRAPDGLAVIDVASRQVIGTLAGVESLPEAVVGAPNGSVILVSNFGSDSVSIIDEPALRARLASRQASGTIEPAGMMNTLPVGTAPNGLAIGADSARAYVTNYGSGTVSVIDIASRTVMAPVQVGINPNSVAISPDGRFAYVSNFTSMEIHIISTATNSIVLHFSLPTNFETHPTALAFSPAGLLYVTTFNFDFGELFGGVVILDTTTNPPTVRGTPLDFRTLGMPNTLPAATQVSPEGDIAFISNFLVEQDTTTSQLRAAAAGGTLLMVDTATNSMIDSMPVGNFPVHLRIAPTAAIAATTTSTPGPSPTPTIGEPCGATRCLPPSLCTRDLGCHRNGCPPRDKCCPAETPDCLACRGGGNDGAACASPNDCPGGECAQ